MKSWIRLASLLVAVIGSISGCGGGKPAPADYVLQNGKVVTMDSERHIYSAIALHGNTIVALGETGKLNDFIGPDTQVVDLQGRMVLPGMIDAHTHPAWSAQDAFKCSLDDEILTLPEITTRVQACLATTAGDANTLFEVVSVNDTLNFVLADLDGIEAVRPMAFESSGAHKLWANSRALALAGIDRNTPDPSHFIMKDGSGNPSGELDESAQDAVLALATAPPLETQAALTQQAFREMTATGITSVQDARVDEQWMGIYKYLYDRGQLNMRVRGAIYLADLNDDSDQMVNDTIAFSQKYTVDPDFLRADSVKIYADGVIEAPTQTAALLEPYLDAMGNVTGTGYAGDLLFQPGKIANIMAKLDAKGFTIHVHAIGDKGVRAALDGIEYARQKNGMSDNRHQIAHLELVDPADFPRFKSLNVLANMQLFWVEHDVYTDDALAAYIGPSRYQHLYPAASIRDAGGTIVGGSDWSVSSFNPFDAIEHGITRSSGPADPPLLAEQALSVDDMLAAYTIKAAFALKQEATTGSLEIGKRADVIVIDRDVTAIDPFDIHNTVVDYTFLDGKLVYDRVKASMAAQVVHRLMASSGPNQTLSAKLALRPHARCGHVTGARMQRSLAVKS